MPTDHSRLSELFLAACDLPEPQQTVLIDKLCRDDPELQRELRRLLSMDAKKDDIFAEDNIVDGCQVHLEIETDLELPAEIGHYRVIRILGEGGMGIVYLAEQENPARDVAVKVVRSGMVNPGLLKRFELEAAILGRLAHPGIASIYEAGTYVSVTTGHERPFLAMEYIEGEPFRTFVEQSRPGLRDRLRMMIQICDAVSHAHQRGVIHRDLKPGNIVVKSDGQPCILDFGVARVTGMNSEQSTVQTHKGQLVGTLPYMSPEQVSGNVLDVDTRSDIYGLGVIAYELMTDQLPYDVRNAEYLKAIQTITQARPTPLYSVRRELRGDLNTIVLKALEKDPNLRYQSAKELGDEFQRYLSDEPILAVPVGPVGRFKKWCRRNTAVAALLSLLAVAIVLGFAGTVTQTLSSLKAKRLAEESAQRTERVLDFLVSSFRSPDPNVNGHDVKMVDVLVNIASDLEEDLAEHPLLQARLLHSIGDSMQSLRTYDQGVRVHKSAFAIRLRELGEEHPDTVASMASLASSHKLAGEHEEAMRLCTRTRELLTKLRGAEHPDTLRAMHTQAILFRAQGNTKDATKLHELTFQLMDRVLGPTHPDTLAAMSSLGGCYLWQGEQIKAFPYLQEALRLSKIHLNEGHPTTTKSLGLLAVASDAMRPDSESLPLHIEFLESHRRLLGEDHPRTLLAMMTTARAYLRTDSESEALKLLETAAAKMKSNLGKDRWPTIECTIYLCRAYLLVDRVNEVLVATDELQETALESDLSENQTLRGRQFRAEALLRTGRSVEAIEILEEIAELKRTQCADLPLPLAKALITIASRYLDAGLFVQAESHLREARGLLQANVKSDHWRQFAVQSSLGATLTEQGNFEEAEPLLLAGGHGLLIERTNPPFPAPREVANSIRRIIRFYELTNRTAEEDRWRKIADENGFRQQTH